MRAPARRDITSSSSASSFSAPPASPSASASVSASALLHATASPVARKALSSPAAAAAAIALETSNSSSTAQRERQQLLDLGLLAQACHRGGRVRGEAFNHFAMGVLHDNLREYSKAIECYQKFARLCEVSNDRAGQLLAGVCKL
jgi:hypothetical protein